MIPKPLAEIEWSDIQALREFGREEDDTIEFKSGFSGGSDFLAFSDAQRAKAVEGIAREAIAFLNGRGGDIVIGVREAANEHPKIEEITPVSNIDQAADRLAQSLAALIEPMQAVIGLRAIRQAAGETGGIIVVRCPSSLRAPHRFKPNRECYVRRGRSSVPMPMDEVHDLTLNRAFARSERDDLLERQFADFSGTRFGLHELGQDRAHFRICFMPQASGEIELDQSTLSNFLGNDPQVSNGNRMFRNDVAFQQLSPIWRPQLRGRIASGFYETNGDFQYSSKSIKRSMILSCDFSIRSNLEVNGVSKTGLYYDWIVGFLANSISSIKSVIAEHMIFATGKIRICVYFYEEYKLVLGERHWAHSHGLPVGTTLLPDFEIDSLESIDRVFQEAQIDICAIAGIECPQPFAFQIE